MNQQILVINTIDEALVALKELVQNISYAPDQIKFSGEITRLKVKIQGDNYHGTFPATFARELWSVQEEFYRAVLFSLGRAENINNLTSAEKEAYLITFHVQEGCIEFEALFEKILESITEVFKTMDSKDKLIAIISIAVILSAGYFGGNSLNHKVDAEVKISDNQLEIAKEKEKTEQFKIFKEVAQSNPDAKRFTQAIDNSSQAMLRGASDADNLTIGANKYDKEDIENARKRTPRAQAKEIKTTGDFYISSTDYRHADSTKYTLRDSSTGKEFNIIVDHTRFKDENLDKLHEAASKRAKINLTLQLESIRDSVKSAELLSVN